MASRDDAGPGNGLTTDCLWVGIDSSGARRRSRLMSISTNLSKKSRLRRSRSEEPRGAPGDIADGSGIVSGNGRVHHARGPIGAEEARVFPVSGEQVEVGTLLWTSPPREGHRRDVDAFPLGADHAGPELVPDLRPGNVGNSRPGASLAGSLCIGLSSFGPLALSVGVSGLGKNTSAWRQFQPAAGAVPGLLPRAGVGPRGHRSSDVGRVRPAPPQHPRPGDDRQAHRGRRPGRPAGRTSGFALQATLPSLLATA